MRLDAAWSARTGLQGFKVEVQLLERREHRGTAIAFDDGCRVRLALAKTLGCRQSFTAQPALRL
jgi:hypothetical protein